MSVMRRWTISTVENLTTSDKERKNDNRKRTGYRMFLSQYCTEFRKLDLVQQQSIIGVPNNNNNNNKNNSNNNNNKNNSNQEEEEEDDDVVIVPPIRYHDIVRAGAFH